jgi:hypothetical protein
MVCVLKVELETYWLFPRESNKMEGLEVSLGHAAGL